MKIWNLYTINSQKRPGCIWLHISCPLCPDGFGHLFIPKTQGRKIYEQKTKKIPVGQTWYIAEPRLLQKSSYHLITRLSANSSVHQNKAESKREVHRQAKHSCKVSNWTDYFYFSTYNYPGFPLPPTPYTSVLTSKS